MPIERQRMYNDERTRMLYRHAMEEALRRQGQAEATLWQLLLVSDAALLGSLAAFLPPSVSGGSFECGIVSKGIYIALGLEILAILLAASATVILLHARCIAEGRIAAEYSACAKGIQPSFEVKVIRRPLSERLARRFLLWFHLAAGLLFSVYLGLTLVFRYGW